MKEYKLEDIVAQGEAVDLEFKSAQGRDGSGELPNNFWETYSAMANTDGGEIFLGIEEKEPGSLNVLGIKDTNKVKKSLWDTINGKNKVNKNILQDSDVEVIVVDDKEIIRATIPRARRQDKPVYLGTNPLGNTYVRRHEGDYKADDETVKRMLAESIEDSRDDKILDGFTIDDLDKETIDGYRNLFSAVRRGNPWIDLPVVEFLEKIGATGKDRNSGKSGLRAGGLLMFGKYEAIRDIFPNYMVDYQEEPETTAGPRWKDRLVPDGTWSGNLYDFFQKAYRKLTSDLKIPFQLKEGVRTDDTPVHEAVREALTNTLIHADFTGRVSVLVVKRPDMFGFRNPGLMRVSLEEALRGGISDCRNRRIQAMFRYVGLGDQAGSGLSKIFRNWKQQHWRAPLLSEDKRHEYTLLELRMISLLPDESVRMLDGLFGERFRQLPELGRIILVTAATEGMVNHDRVKQLSTAHRSDITAMLAALVQEHILVKEGETRASFYKLPAEIQKQPEKSDDISISSSMDNSQDLAGNSQDLGRNSPHLSGNSPYLDGNSPHLSGNSPYLNALLAEILASLGYKTMPGKVKQADMQAIIKGLCRNRAVSLKELSRLLNRNPKALQEKYLTSMVNEGVLELKYPTIKNHPDQAYKTKGK
ncbi:MAG: putative DNA binding domain-containing protein [Elusimicrobia bacterium]|nr:putative DNA binding domain-containing protein [Candidatus Liberimonas magnetica]